MNSDMEKGMVAQTPLGRIGAPDDIARVAVFLASDDSHWITGELLPCQWRPLMLTIAS